MGRLIVKQLGEHANHDVLSRWLAHYISQQINLAKSAKGPAKAVAEERCFETILKLWKHRASFASGMRPFENYEGIFKVLERIDPENPTPFYRFPGKAEQEPENQTDPTQTWLDNALAVDGMAKAMIQYSLEKAAEKAGNDESLALFNEAIELLEDHELEVLIRFIKTGEQADGEDSEKALREKFEKATRTKIARLDEFIRASKAIRESLVLDLKVGPSKRTAPRKTPLVVLPPKRDPGGSPGDRRVKNPSIPEP